MKKLYSILSVFIFTIIITSTSWANPCRPLAEACMQQGYYKGGNNVGKGLAENCMMPVIQHQKSLPNATFSDENLQECKVVLMKKMQES